MGPQVSNFQPSDQHISALIGEHHHPLLSTGEMELKASSSACRLDTNNGGSDKGSTEIKRSGHCFDLQEHLMQIHKAAPA